MPLVGVREGNEKHAMAKGPITRQKRREQPANLRFPVQGGKKGARRDNDECKHFAGGTKPEN